MYLSRRWGKLNYFQGYFSNSMPIDSQPAAFRETTRHLVMLVQRALRRSAAMRHSRAMSSVTIEFPGSYETHRCEAPDAVAETSKEELLECVPPRRNARQRAPPF